MDTRWSISKINQVCTLMEMEIDAKPLHTPLLFSEKTSLLEYLESEEFYQAYLGRGLIKFDVLVHWSLLYDNALFISLMARPQISLSLCCSFDEGLTFFSQLESRRALIPLIAKYVPLDKFNLTDQSVLYDKLPADKLYTFIISHTDFLQNKVKWLEQFLLSYLEHYPGDINANFNFRDIGGRLPHVHTNIPSHLVKFMSQLSSDTLYSYRTNLNKVLSILSQRVLHLQIDSHALKYNALLDNLKPPRFINLYLSYLLRIKPTFTLAHEPKAHSVMFDALYHHPLKTELTSTLVCYLLERNDSVFLNDVLRKGVDVHHVLKAGPYCGLSVMSQARRQDEKQSPRSFFGKLMLRDNLQKKCLSDPISLDTPVHQGRVETPPIPKRAQAT